MAQGCALAPLQVPPAEWQHVGSATGEKGNRQWVCLTSDKRAGGSTPGQKGGLNTQSPAAQHSALCQQGGKPVSNAHNAPSVLGFRDEGLPHCGGKEQAGERCQLQSLRAVQSCTGWGGLVALLHSKERSLKKNKLPFHCTLVSGYL